MKAAAIERMRMHPRGLPGWLIIVVREFGDEVEELIAMGSVWCEKVSSSIEL